MQVLLEMLTKVGNNCLADLYLDGVKVNAGGPLQMSPHEFALLSDYLQHGTSNFAVVAK